MSNLLILAIWGCFVTLISTISTIVVYRKLVQHDYLLQAEITKSERELLEDFEQVEQLELEQTQSGRELLILLQDTIEFKKNMSEKKKLLAKIDGTKKLRESIQASIVKLFPDVSKSNLRPLSNDVLLKLSEHIDKGYIPAVAKPKPDGTTDIIVMYPEEIQDKLKKKK